MKKLLKPVCLAFYILVLLVFFMIGLGFAGLIDAGKNQGLAGGAIVLSYGILFGLIAFIVSFFIAYFLKLRILVRLNWLLFVVLLCGIGLIYFRHKNRTVERTEILEKPSQTTAPADGEWQGSFLQGN